MPSEVDPASLDTYAEIEWLDEAAERDLDALFDRLFDDE